MYNRYLRNERGDYVRVPEEDEQQPEQPPVRPPEQSSRPPEQPPHTAPPEGPPPDASPPPETGRDSPRRPAPPPSRPAGQDPLRHFLDQLRLQRIDSGDLLLLGLLFLLFREDADEELLTALGLLLIL